MGDSTGTKSNVVTLAEEMQEPDPKDLVFINVCRQSSPGQDSVDDQEKDNNNDLKWMGASPCPETFIVKLTQSTSGGKDRKDFERIKHLVEVGVDG